MSEYLQNNANQTPGAVLRRGRESSRLSKTEVAQQLRLTVDTIERIEADDYEKLPAVTFVRGYIRAYARLLKLPADEIVAEFDRLGHTDQPGEFSTQKIYGERTAVSEKMLWVMAIVFAAVVGVMVIWWQYHAGTGKIKSTSTGKATDVVKQLPATTTNNHQIMPTTNSNLISDILQSPQMRTPPVMSNTQNKSPSVNHDQQNGHTDETQGQKLEDVQTDLASPF